MENNEAKRNPLIQGDHSSIAVKDLNNNVDNHTDSHDVITNNSNTVNQNSTVVYNGSAASEKLLSERREEYRIFCQKNIVSRIISRNTRIELNDMASRLRLDQITTEEIERSVLSKLESGSLSHTDRITLNMAIDALQNDSARDMVDKLTVLADKSEDEDVQYYANLALTVYDPRRCAQRYEQRQFDSYWQTFWAYLAYKRNGNNHKAEELLTHLTAWADQPEDQATLLSGAGFLYDYFAVNGGEGLKKTALGYLNSCDSLSGLLESFIVALQYLCSVSRPLYYSDEPRIDLFLSIFGAKIRPSVKSESKSFGTVPSPVSKSIDTPLVTDPKIIEIAQRANSQQPAKTPVETSTVTPTNPAQQPYRFPSQSESHNVKQSSGGKGKYLLIGIVVVAVLYFIFRPSSSDKREQVDKELTTELASTQRDRDNSETTNGDSSNKQKSSTVTSEKKRSIDKSTSTANNNKPTDIKNVETIEDKNPVKDPKVEESVQPKVSEIDQLTAKVASGDMQAAYKLGNKYFEGDGVQKSFSTAFDYFNKSAAGGNVEAMYMVGLCYRMGRGTTKNLDLAKQWWSKAASHGHSQAAQGVEDLKSLM